MSRERGVKVVGNPREYMIRQMLISGWSPEKVARWLEQKHPDDRIHADTIRSYRENFLTPQEILDPSRYKKTIKNIDVKIDALQELYDAVEIQKRRIARLLVLEDASDIALQDTRHEMTVLAKMLVSILDKEMDLGVRDRRADVTEEYVYDLTAFLERSLERRKILEANR